MVSHFSPNGYQLITVLKYFGAQIVPDLSSGTFFMLAPVGILMLSSTFLSMSLFSLFIIWLTLCL